MKLRIHSNSLRLRLSRSEVARLGAGGRVEQAVAFAPEQRLVYAVEAAADAPALEARWERGEIAVRIPLDAARRWAETEQVGIEAEQRVEGAEPLRLLVEKDFPCQHRGEAVDGTETFGELMGGQP